MPQAVVRHSIPRVPEVEVSDARVEGVKAKGFSKDMVLTAIPWNQAPT